MKTARRTFGDIGEDLAETFLMKRGFSIVERNYNRKWGEIDIVARETFKNTNTYRFIEVKTVSCENVVHISHETLIDSSLTENDPTLIMAAQLGKNALRDEQLMVMLWNKFKNQNKIALFLGVGIVIILKQ